MNAGDAYFRSRKVSRALGAWESKEDKEFCRHVTHHVAAYAASLTRACHNSQP